eukprot:TRINITY_DN1283_c0_g2_i1.p1 TRINITY_DN1283_c0_g2~~TRINITY_DN1283_c0_g2_i1.p1  ORF type:complete len:871 (-),score=174.74 TRINITY_DN1283_c0_g2_i1:841-3453(-)
MASGSEDVALQDAEEDEEDIDDALEREALKYNMNARQVKLMLKNILQENGVFSMFMQAATVGLALPETPMSPSRPRRAAAQRALETIPFDMTAEVEFPVNVDDDEEEDEYMPGHQLMPEQETAEYALFLESLQEIQRPRLDDEDDDEYNYMEELARDDETEEFREDRAVRVSQKELDALLHEPDYYDFDQLGIPGLEPDVVEEDLLFSDLQLTMLHNQMRAHLMLAANSFLRLWMDEQKEDFDTVRGWLETLLAEAVSRSGSDYPFPPVPNVIVEDGVMHVVPVLHKSPFLVLGIHVIRRIFEHIGLVQAGGQGKARKMQTRHELVNLLISMLSVYDAANDNMICPPAMIAAGQRPIFSAIEDEWLIKAFWTFGPRHSERIRTMLPHRSIHQIQVRWKNMTAPKRGDAAFLSLKHLTKNLLLTYNEHLTLVKSVATHGSDFAAIQRQLLPNYSVPLLQAYYKKEIAPDEPERQKRPAPAPADGEGWSTAVGLPLPKVSDSRSTGAPRLQLEPPMLLAEPLLVPLPPRSTVKRRKKDQVLQAAMNAAVHAGAVITAPIVIDAIPSTAPFTATATVSNAAPSLPRVPSVPPGFQPPPSVMKPVVDQGVAVARAATNVMNAGRPSPTAQTTAEPVVIVTPERATADSSAMTRLVGMPPPSAPAKRGRVNLSNGRRHSPSRPVRSRPVPDGLQPMLDARRRRDIPLPKTNVVPKARRVDSQFVEDVHADDQIGGDYKIAVDEDSNSNPFPQGDLAAVLATPVSVRPSTSRLPMEPLVHTLTAYKVGESPTPTPGGTIPSPAATFGTPLGLMSPAVRRGEDSNSGISELGEDDDASRSRPFAAAAPSAPVLVNTLTPRQKPPTDFSERFPPFVRS